jgi:hypothetical protein
LRQSIQTIPDPAHQVQIGLADRLWQVVHRATADAGKLGLTLDRQVGRWVDDLLALSNPTLVSAPSKKSFSSVTCPILACSSLRSTGASRGPDLPKHIGCGLAQRFLPLGDLVGVHIKSLCQLRQRLVFSQRQQCDFRFEHR